MLIQPYVNERNWRWMRGAFCSNALSIKALCVANCSTVDADTVATILIATIEGAVMLSKLYGDASHLERALNFLKTYVQHQLSTV